ncbi:COG1361 S-layer family protein [Haloarcula laminariae]|uniref:COG1361 S-layer family protein n=1 Tax=Haloarcula laminariae TaxID=2961577 RepID=UPI0021C89DD9|nr:COG1361 S-layer family protein [Halomicroarcula laminariae]
MKHSSIAGVLLVVVLTVSAGTAAAAVSGSPDLDVTLSEDTVSPGEETTLDVVLSNSGDLDSASSANPSLNSEVTTARSLSVDVEGGNAPITVMTNRRHTGDLATGSPRTVSFDISVADDAEPGTYRVPVNVEYDYYNLISESGGARSKSSVSRTRYVTVRVSDDATFETVDIDSSVRVGSTDRVGLTIQNTGETAATDAAVTLTSQNSELTVGGSEQSSRFVETWEPGENRTFEYRVGASSDAKAEPYNFGLSVAFDDTDGVREESTDTTFGIAPQPEQEFSLSNVSGTLRAGDDRTLETELTNDGPRAVENAVVVWGSDHRNLSPQETEYAVGRLESGESTTVSFGVDTSESAREGPRQFDFSVNYNDGTSERQTSDTLSVQSDVAASEDAFDLAVTNKTIPVGNSRTVSVEVTNNLDETVTDIEARLFTDDPLSTVGTDSSYIESLAPGESATLAFDVSAGSAATEGSSYPMSFDFRYSDSDGDTHLSDTFRKPVDAVSQSGGGPPIGIILGLGVVIVGGVAVFYWRRD